MADKKYQKIVENLLTRRKRTLPLHLQIVTVFLLTMSLIAGSILYSYWEHVEEGAVTSGKLAFEATEQQVSARMGDNFDALSQLVSSLERWPSIQKNDPESTVLGLMRSLDIWQFIFAAYVADEHGNFLNVVSMRDTENSDLRMGAPPGTVYLIQRIGPADQGLPTEWIYYNADLEVIGLGTPPETPYDARTRPWYQAATEKNDDQLAISPPYAFSDTGFVGITFSRTGAVGDRQIVLGGDILLRDMNNLLDRFALSIGHRIFLFDDDGTMLAYPNARNNDTHHQTSVFDRTVRNAADLRDTLSRQTFKYFQENGEFDSHLVNHAGERFLSSVHTVYDAGDRKYHLAMVAPMYFYTDPVMSIGRKGLIGSLIIFLISVPLIYFVSRRISKPIIELTTETEKIARLNLDGHVSVDTRIREIDDLAAAVIAMKGALRSMTRFIPEVVVRETLRQDARPEVGGESRELTLMFTDVADFTNISADMPAEELMLTMSEYFDGLVDIIMDNKGTVDKYIGDAVMAFWNAPDEQDNHVLHACRAALACKFISNILAETWESEERRGWYTRFGLHTGETVFGNVGTKDRMNYTTVGTSVNIAARLESMNKHYGSQILVSSRVQEIAADSFLFRPIDYALPKGAKEPIRVYELMGGLDDPGSLNASEEMFMYCASWDRAQTLYIRRQWNEALQAFKALTPPDGEPDPVLDFFLERLEKFSTSPPPPDWDGIYRFSEK